MCKPLLISILNNSSTANRTQLKKNTFILTPLNLNENEYLIKTKFLPYLGCSGKSQKIKCTGKW